jgi:hypothetical protein
MRSDPRPSRPRILVSLDCTHDNLVSDGTGSSTMPPVGSGSRKENNTFDDDLGKHLERLKELVPLFCAWRNKVPGSVTAPGRRRGGGSSNRERRRSLRRPEWCPWLSLAQLQRRGEDADFAISSDQPPHSVHKIEFPKFDGMSDPTTWLNHCQ